MVDGLFFCATHTDHKGGHTPFVQEGAEMSDTSAEGLSRNHAVVGSVIPREWVPVSVMKVRSRKHRGLSAHSSLNW